MNGAAAAGYRGRCSPCPSSRRATSAGGLVAVLFTEERIFTDDDLELARHLADATRGALERSDLFEGERSARALAQQLTRTGRLLTSELDPDAVLDEVVQQAPDLVNADACAIRVLEDDELVVNAAVGLGADAATGSRVPASSLLSGDVVQSRAPVALEDAGSDPRLRAVDPMLAAGHAAYLGVPLAGPEGTPLGVLAVYAREPRPWRPEEVEAMLALAASTSAALSNAELYQRVALEKERSFAILANIADGIVAVDREGRVVLWNEAAEQITGVPAGEALGQAPDEVLQGTLGSGSDTPAGDRLVSITRSREEVWLSVTEAVMRDPAGNVNGRIFAFRDISSDRLVEQMKSDFVSTVSHELRTPLTSIYGFAETLLRQDVLFGDEERQTFLGYIASESQRLTGIVDALLNVARLDTGDLQVRLAPTDVLGVLDELVHNVEESGANGHHFVLDAKEESLAATADRDKLRQVCSILLDNALKYSPAGGTVTVGIERKQHTVEVSVADQGIGIPQADQDQIFRKFYRGADVESRAGASGTGLGLFIARGLVTAMGGRIWVESREGEGSTFAFELPAAGVTAAPLGIGRVCDESSRNRRRGADPPALPREPRGGGDGRARGGRRPERARQGARAHPGRRAARRDDARPRRLAGRRAAARGRTDERDPDHLPDRPRRVPRPRPRPRHRRRRLRHEAVQPARAGAARTRAARPHRARRARRAPRREARCAPPADGKRLGSAHAKTPEGVRARGR